MPGAWEVTEDYLDTFYQWYSDFDREKDQLAIIHYVLT
jgi:hypothetical protein